MRDFMRLGLESACKRMQLNANALHNATGATIPTPIGADWVMFGIETGPHVPQWVNRARDRVGS